jgi:hypothetical protein
MRPLRNGSKAATRPSQLWRDGGLARKLELILFLQETTLRDAEHDVTDRVLGYRELSPRLISCNVRAKHANPRDHFLARQILRRHRNGLRRMNAMMAPQGDLELSIHPRFVREEHFAVESPRPCFYKGRIASAKWSS